MKTLNLMLSTLTALNDTGLIIPSAQRVEFKRTRSGSWRLYVAPAPNMKQTMMAPVLQLLEGKGVTANAFAKNGLITGITFVDDNEDTDENSGQ